VATPVTFERYTGNWQGSFEGWRPTCKYLNLSMDKTLPGLKNFYMVGHWVQPGGGLPPAAASGRDVVQILCKKDKKNFVAYVV
jgi:phytoene dehydrogenase-like protein